MHTKHLVVSALVIVFAAMPAAPGIAGQSALVVSGTAKKEAKRPYTDQYVRARLVSDGTIGMAVPLSATAEFVLGDLAPGQYVLELLNKEGKVVCTEGPLTFAKNTSKIVINCGRDRKPLLLLLAAAGAAGITAGIVANGSASPSR